MGSDEDSGKLEILAGKLFLLSMETLNTKVENVGVNGSLIVIFVYSLAFWFDHCWIPTIMPSQPLVWMNFAEQFCHGLTSIAH